MFKPSNSLSTTGFILWTCILLIGSSLGDKNCTKDYMANMRLKLEKCMLDNYKTNIRPTKSIQNSTEVYLEFAAMDARFYSKLKTFYLLGVIRAEWVDEYLAWNPADYGGLTLTQVDSKTIWTPPLFYEGVEGAPYSTIFSNSVTDVNSNGNVSYMNFVNLKSTCVSNLKHFPRDEHVCFVTLDTMEELKLRLFSQNGFEVSDPTLQNFVLMMMMGYAPESQVFKMLNVTLEVEEYELIGMNMTISNIEIMVKLKRITSIVGTIYLKAFSIGILLLIPMFVPVTSVHRMALPLLTFFGSLYAIDRIDDIVNIYTSEDVPFIIIYYRNVILLSLFILCESFVYLLLSELPMELPDSLEALYTRLQQHGLYNYLDSIRNFYRRSNFENESLYPSSSEKKHTFVDLMQMVDTFLSYLMFLLMTIFYLILIFG